jgi:hypothetical protein
MLAEPESQMRIRITSHVQVLGGLAEDPLVAVGRPVPHDHLVVGR